MLKIVVGDSERRIIHSPGNRWRQVHLHTERFCAHQTCTVRDSELERVVSIVLALHQIVGLLCQTLETKFVRFQMAVVAWDSADARLLWMILALGCIFFQHCGFRHVINPRLFFGCLVAGSCPPLVKLALIQHLVRVLVQPPFDLPQPTFYIKRCKFKRRLGQVLQIVNSKLPLAVFDQPHFWNFRGSVVHSEGCLFDHLIPKDLGCADTNFVFVPIFDSAFLQDNVNWILLRAPFSETNVRCWPPNVLPFVPDAVGVGGLPFPALVRNFNPVCHNCGGAGRGPDVELKLGYAKIVRDPTPPESSLRCFWACCGTAHHRVIVFFVQVLNRVNRNQPRFVLRRKHVCPIHCNESGVPLPKLVGAAGNRAGHAIVRPFRTILDALPDV